MLTLPLLLCALLSQAPQDPTVSAARTPPAKAPVARIVGLSGATQVTAGAAKVTPVGVGTDLDERDVVTVGAGAWVVLALFQNNRVVRLDDELSIAVSKLALLKAQPVATSIGEQLNRVLSPEERKAVQADRLMGWHASQAAANTMPVKEKEADAAATPQGPRKRSASGAPKAAEAEERSRPADEEDSLWSKAKRAFGSDRAEEAPAAEPAAERRKQPAPAPAAAPAPRGPPGSPPTAGGPASPPPPPPAPPAEPVMTPEATSNERVKVPRREAKPTPRSLAVDETLTTCLAGALGALDPELPAKLGKVELLLQKKAAKQLRVRLEGGLPVPSCAVDWAQARADLVGDTEQRLLVPLAK